MLLVRIQMSPVSHYWRALHHLQLRLVRLQNNFLGDIGNFGYT